MTHERNAVDAFRGRHVVSAEDFSKDEILALLDAAQRFDRYESGGPTWRSIAPSLTGRVLGLLFFEPSTRTRLSFESAMLRLGGSVLGFADARMSSFSKGESLVDTIRVVEGYCDAIVLRHPQGGRRASRRRGRPRADHQRRRREQPAPHADVPRPLHDAPGGGAPRRPASVGFMGDLRYGRTVHSLATALLHFDVELKFIGPENLRLPEDLRDTAARAPDRLDVGGHARWRRPATSTCSTSPASSRSAFPDPMDYERVRNAYRVDRAVAGAPFGERPQDHAPASAGERGGHRRGRPPRRDLLPARRATA